MSDETKEGGGGPGQVGEDGTEPVPVQSRAQIRRKDNKTRNVRIGDWVKDDERKQSFMKRLPTQLRQEMAQEKSWFQRTFCCCCGPNRDHTIEKTLEDINVTLYELEYLKMSTTFKEREILLLARQYDHLKTLCGKTRKVSSGDILKLPEFRYNPLKDRIGMVMEMRNEGKAEFTLRDFVREMSVFSHRASLSEKCRFLFEVYDFDSDGFVSKDDLREVLHLTLGDHLNYEQIEACVDRTFHECTAFAAQYKDRLGASRASHHETIDLRTFTRVLSNTDVGSKVNIDITGIERTNRLLRLKTLDVAGDKKKKKSKRQLREEKESNKRFDIGGMLKSVSFDDRKDHKSESEVGDDDDDGGRDDEKDLGGGDDSPGDGKDRRRQRKSGKKSRHGRTSARGSDDDSQRDDSRDSHSDDDSGRRRRRKDKGRGKGRGRKRGKGRSKSGGRRNR